MVRGYPHAPRCPPERTSLTRAGAPGNSPSAPCPPCKVGDSRSALSSLVCALLNWGLSCALRITPNHPGLAANGNPKFRHAPPGRGTCRRVSKHKARHWTYSDARPYCHFSAGATSGMGVYPLSFPEEAFLRGEIMGANIILRGVRRTFVVTLVGNDPCVVPQSGTTR